MKLQSSTVTIALVFVLWFGMAFSCADDSSEGTQALPLGSYAFMSLTTFRDDGTSKTSTNLLGSLVISSNGRYEHDLWMGNTPFGCGPGTYKISGNQLKLRPDPPNGCNGLEYNFLYDSEKNRLSLVTEDRDVALLLCKVGEPSCFKTE